MMMEKLPIYRFVVSEDDDSGLEAVALVDNPAIEMNWQAFNSAERKQMKFTANHEKKIIAGPLMVADLPIYRRDGDKEYYCVFTAEDIFNLRNKFCRNMLSKSVNLMHDSSQQVSGVFMIENFIIDSERGVVSPKGYSLTDGSWWGGYKVDNEEVWDEFIKSGEFKGFSVEGVFNSRLISEEPIDIIEQMINIVKQIDEK